MEDFLEKYAREPVDFTKCKYIVAPMVDFSELPFRLMCLRYGADLCYTPMIHAGQFVQSATLRAQEMQTCAADKPLIVQFCANDAAIFSTAAQYVAPYCDAVDLNLGCPQQIARRGHYGAFLTEWNMIDDILRTARRNVNVPITCKVRLQDSVERTIEYVRMLVRTGVSAIALHGRTREHIRDRAGAADWTAVRQVIEAVNGEVPMFANGSIRTLADADRCVAETGACGVLIAESALHNPSLFTGNPTRAPYLAASDYLDMVAATWDVRCDADAKDCRSQAETIQNGRFASDVHVIRKWSWAVNSVRGHIFKILHLLCAVDSELRDRIARARTFQEFRQVVQLARERCERDAAAFACGKLDEATTDPHFVPYWEGHSYFLPDEHIPDYIRRNQNRHRRAEVNVVQTQAATQDVTLTTEELVDSVLDALPLIGLDAPTNVIHKEEKLRKRKQRAMNMRQSRRAYTDCVDCSNPRSELCTNRRCRKCCIRFVFCFTECSAKKQETDEDEMSDSEEPQCCEIHHCVVRTNGNEPVAVANGD